MAGKQRYTAAQVIAAIRGTFGIKTEVADALGCTRQTVDNYIERYPTIAKAYQEERERLVDAAEGKFVGLIKQGEWKAIRFALSTLGKSRGFIQRHEVEQLSDSTVRVEWGDGDGDGVPPETASGPEDGSELEGEA